MGRRIDHVNDPHAPTANSLAPSANAIVTNEAGEILMIRRTDNGNWSLPGGAMDLGESLGQTAIRETREETGIDIELTGVSGIYTNPDHVIEYTSNGEVRQEFSVVFIGEPIGGTPTPSSESSRVEWMPVSALSDIQMHPSMRSRILFFLQSEDGVYWD